MIWTRSWGGRGIELAVAGGISDLRKVEGVNSQVVLNINALSEDIKATIDAFLADKGIQFSSDMLPQSTKLNAIVGGSLKKLSIEDLAVEITDPATELTVSGNVADAITREGVDAVIKLNSSSLADFSKYAKTQLPELGPLNVSGQIKSNNQNLALESLTAKLDSQEMKVNLAAKIADISTLKGISVELDTQINSLSELSGIVKSDLPVTEPITLNARIDSEGMADNEAAKIAVNVQSGGADINLSGNLSDLKSAEDIEIKLEATAPSLANLNQFAQAELPEVGPLNLSGTLKAKSNAYGLQGFKLTLDDQSVDGDVGIIMAESDDDLSTLKGEVNIGYLDLSPYITPTGDSTESIEQTEQTKATQLETKETKEDREVEQAITNEDETLDSAERLFSSEPLPLDQLRKIDAEFTIKGDRIKLGKTDLTDVDFALSLNDGLLKVAPIEALASPGTVDGEISLDARDSDIAHLDVRLTVDNAPMPNLGGSLEFHLNLDGSGASIADLMGGLNGQLLIVIRDGKIEQSFVTGVGTGLFSFSGGSDYTTLECGIFRTDIVDGIAKFDNKIAAQLTAVNWRGGGEVNLKTEKLDVGVAPKPRKGLGIDVGVGSLASLIHVGGTLKNPSVQLDPKDVAMKYGKYMAAVSTGGLSILAEAVLNKSQADVDLCEKILTGTVFDEDAEIPDEKTSEPPADGDNQANTNSSQSASDVDATSGDSDSKDAPQGSKSDENKKKKAPLSKNLQ